MVSQPSERIAIAGRVDPQTVANTEVFSDVIDMLRFAEAMGIALLGNMANETLDFRVCTCNSDGSSPVTLKAITQLAASATNNDLKQVAINVKADDMPSTARYIKFGLVTGGATGGPAAVIALGLIPKFAPASDWNLATVVQIKS